MTADSGGSRVTNVALTSGAATVTFAARYSHVEVKNEAATAETMYVRTDGTTPASPWNNAYAVTAGERILVPNSAIMWWQGFGAADGTKTNPGTTVNIVSATGASTSPVEVTGV
jgi:hypothetical protein